MDVTICIPTKNGGAQLDKVLEAVFKQQTSLSFEVVCVDSGSIDNTISVITKYPSVRLHRIPANQFGHGKTRNLAASLGTGEFVVFLTQDALPASDSWLDNLVHAVKADDNCVLGFGIHYAYPGCNVLDERDIRLHFNGFGQENTYYHLDDPQRYAVDEGYRHLLAFSSDNNACLRRSVFEKYPYPDVEFAEDQIWARQMIELGYTKVYCPSAPVYHSHNYPVSEYFRRYYDEYKGLRQIHNYKMHKNVVSISKLSYALVRNDVTYIRTLPMTREEKFKWCWYALRRDTSRCIAGYIGGTWMDRALKTRIWQDKMFSQQYKQRNRKSKGKKTLKGGVTAMKGKYATLFKKGLHYLKHYDETQNAAMEIAAAKGCEVPVGDGLIHVEQIYNYVINTEQTPFSPEQYELAKKGKKIVHWIIPEMGIGSGGHINIFRFVSALQKMGIQNRIYLMEMNKLRSDEMLRNFLSEHYPILDSSVEVHCDVDRMPFCHALVATGWNTAYYVRNNNNTISKFYFVQDFEPYFYSVGSEYMFANNTYQFGFRGLTAGDWLKDKLSKEFKMDCTTFRFSYDKDLYYPIEKRDDHKRLFFYARPVTPRRAWEAGLLALVELHRRIPEIEVIFAGWDISNYAIPFTHLNAGSVKLSELADLYAQCDISIVMSLTNLSLLPLEIMASGGVIATQSNDENNSWMLNESNSIIIDYDPIHIADQLEYYLNHREKLSALREAGIAFAQSTNWEKETKKVYDAILKGIEEDEQKL